MPAHNHTVGCDGTGSSSLNPVNNIPGLSDDRNASVGDDVRAAANSYREAFRQSQDPLVSLLRRFGDGAGDFVGAGANRVRDWMTGSGGRDAGTGDAWSAATNPPPDGEPT